MDGLSAPSQPASIGGRFCGWRVQARSDCPFFSARVPRRPQRAQRRHRQPAAPNGTAQANSRAGAAYHRAGTGRCRCRPRPTAAPPAAAASQLRLPTYVPSPSMPPPDFPATESGLQAGYKAYPKNLTRSVRTAAGLGGEVTGLTSLPFPPPTPLEDNQAWQAVNKEINANAQAAHGAQRRTTTTRSPPPWPVVTCPTCSTSTPLAPRCPSCRSS